MIAYPKSRAELEALIEGAVPGWLKRASERTAAFRRQGRYEEKSPIWSDVKVVYMRLQGGSKCIFCERKLESEEYGKGEQDVEHFRPKGRVRAWKLPKSLRDEGVVLAAVPKEDHGYYLLPYHPLNYSAACKPCNSALKSDYFPIAGKYSLKADDVEKMKSEKALLIYPIRDFDDDPEDLIGFHGISPYSVAPGGHARNRALTTIEFFKLDDEAKRKNLFRDRAMVIIALHAQMVVLDDGASGKSKTIAEDLIAGFTSEKAPHANCARCHKKLFEVDRKAAFAEYESVVRYFDSIS